jgi:c-di-GMP-related signal transduction protein
VDTVQQLEQLRELGCDRFQGFYRSAAVLPGEIQKLLQPAGVMEEPGNQRIYQETQSKLAVFKRS